MESGGVIKRVINTARSTVSPLSGRKSDFADRNVSIAVVPQPTRMSFLRLTRHRPENGPGHLSLAWKESDFDLDFN